MSELQKYFKRFLLIVINALRPCKRLAPRELPLKFIRRIIIVKQHDQLGDLLITTPVIRAVRKYFPNAHITVLVREYTAPLIWENPHVDEVIVFTEKLKNWKWEKVKFFWNRLRADGGYDCAMMLNSVSRSLTSDLLAVLSKAKYIIGPNHLSLDREIPEKIYDVLTPRNRTLQPETENYLDIIRALGIPSDGFEYDLSLSGEEQSEADRLLYDLGISNNALKIGIHFGALNKEKRLPLDKFVKAVEWIKKNYSCEILLFAGPADEHIRDQFVGRLSKTPFRIIPVLPLRNVAAVIRRLNLLLCNDTGTMHIASALRVPTISFHSISDPTVWKPQHERHIGIRAKDKKITSITVDQIVEALNVQLKNFQLSKLL
jgi:heptosyltransferase II